MAEIKSTIEMVMERAARIAAEATDTSEDQSAEHKGMRYAAAYLSGKESDLLGYIKKQPPKEQMNVRSGMARTLLRNIILPRDEEISEQALSSLKALQELSGNSADIANICNELKQILEQYNQHKKQVKDQLDESVRAQLKEKLLQQGHQLDDDMSLNPAMHPQYQEEWSRVSADLNAQYNQALDQRKDAIKLRMGG
ncbi:MAG: hypothetical protein HKP41_15985 [Desulfobacterales bacterium]|nr:hypothetical protein [Deltaproteobacteria bacterium]NNK95851.1 hypothetical protein [Desulfobacterales bacterium]